MPGHKGLGPMGCESFDITEISGADSLYAADGIIAESEQNASALFDSNTFYSTEGSSHCIRAMLYLAMMASGSAATVKIAAGRNVHKSFLTAAAMLDVDVEWLYPQEQVSYLSCRITAPMLEKYLGSCGTLPAAVYITSPDYLGNILDISPLAEVCHRFGVLLLVDNAHGAYLKFLPGCNHPMDQGADLCCDSAHKTLPVLTGGAYLHIRDEVLAQQAKHALSLFGSTSPSYLILQSLDAANAILDDPGYRKKLGALAHMADDVRKTLTQHGFSADYGDEPLKITLLPKSFGYTGTEIASILRASNIECEFSDPDHLVMMLSTGNTVEDLQKLTTELTAIPRRDAIMDPAPLVGKPEKVLSIRQALFSPSEWIPAVHSAGRILAAASVGCPPAVPVVVGGERIDQQAVHCFDYYGITYCRVVCDPSKL